MSILLLHRKEGSLEEQGSEKTGRRKQPALISDPHTASHVEISGLQFSFAQPPTLWVKQGRARPGQWVWLAGCHVLSQGYLPTWLVCTRYCQAAGASSLLPHPTKRSWGLG